MSYYMDRDGNSRMPTGDWFQNIQNYVPDGESDVDYYGGVHRGHYDLETSDAEIARMEGERHTYYNKLKMQDAQWALEDENKALAARLAALENRPEPVAPVAPEPEKKEPTGPIEYSDEIKGAWDIVNKGNSGFSWNKDKESPSDAWNQAQSIVNSSGFNQNDTDFTSAFNPSGKGDEAPKKAQAFADKYKLNLINSGATKQADTTPDNPMSANDILANDKKRWGPGLQTY